MINSFQEKQIHIIHMDSVICKPYFTVNNKEFTEMMGN